MVAAASAGPCTITAARPVPDDFRAALTKINNASRVRTSLIKVGCYGHLNRRRSPGEPHDLHKQSFTLPPRFRSSGLVALRSGSALSRATWHLLSRATWHASAPSSLAPPRTGMLDDYLHGHVLLY
jgi:hypothetical protein